MADTTVSYVSTVHVLHQTPGDRFAALNRYLGLRDSSCVSALGIDSRLIHRGFLSSVWVVSAVVSDYSVGKTLLELGGKAAAYAVAYDKASFSSAAHRELLWFMVNSTWIEPAKTIPGRISITIQQTR